MASDDGGAKTWLIVGASRGIGHEFAEQLLARGDRVIATIRGNTSSFWPDRNNITVLNCDVAVDKVVNTFVQQLSEIQDLKAIDYVIINAGVLLHPSRSTEMSFDDFSFHLRTNCVGPIYVAQQLLKLDVSIGAIVFISSDSGSLQEFRAMEDGFSAYAASKAALNMAARHMDAELKRKERKTSILCLHPGEVKTDMANLELGWEVEGIMTPQESVKQCIQTIESKTYEDSGTFWKWENRPQPW